MQYYLIPKIEERRGDEMTMDSQYPNQTQEEKEMRNTLRFVYDLYKEDKRFFLFTLVANIVIASLAVILHG